MAYVTTGFGPDDIAHLVVHRDPCPVCGTRNDIGCKHKDKRQWLDALNAEAARHLQELRDQP